MKRLPILLALALLLAGCDLSMTQQRKYKTYAPAPLLANGSAAQPLPDGVVAAGDAERRNAELNPPPVSDALLARGRERFDIFCAPCHGLAGDGDGIIVAHGFPPPPSYHIDRLRAAPAQHFYDVMTRGYGAMYAYSDRLDPHDRWAVASYIRALQLSRRATLAQVPEAKEMLR